MWSPSIFPFIFAFSRPRTYVLFRWILRARQSSSVEGTNALACLEKWDTFVLCSLSKATQKYQSLAQISWIVFMQTLSVYVHVWHSGGMNVYKMINVCIFTHTLKIDRLHNFPKNPLNVSRAYRISSRGQCTRKTYYTVLSTLRTSGRRKWTKVSARFYNWKRPGSQRMYASRVT